MLRFLFVYESSNLHLTTPTLSTFLRVLFASFLSAGWATNDIDCLALTKNKRKVSLPRTQRRNASLGIEPGANNLSIINPTLYQPRYRRQV